MSTRSYAEASAELSQEIASVEAAAHAEILRLENLLGAARDRLASAPDRLRASFAALMHEREIEVQRAAHDAILPHVRSVRTDGVTRSVTADLSKAWRAANEESIYLVGHSLDEWRVPLAIATLLVAQYPETVELFAHPETFTHGAHVKFAASAAALHKFLSAGADVVAIQEALGRLDRDMATTCSPGNWSRNSAGVPDAQARFDVARFGGTSAARAAALAALDRDLELRRQDEYESDRQRTIRIREGRETSEDLAFLSRNHGFVEGIKGLSDRLFGAWKRDDPKPVQVQK